MGEPITIINECGWPRLSNSRITIFDLFPFFRDGENYETILRWMPTLSREALIVAQGQLQLSRCAHEHLQQEAFVPATKTAFHDDAVAAGMLLQQRQNKPVQPGEVLAQVLLANA